MPAPLSTPHTTAPSPWASRLAALALTVVALATTGCGPAPSAASPPPGEPAASSAGSPATSGSPASPSTTPTDAQPAPATAAPAAPPQGTALDLLGTLPVKGRAPKTGYARDQFGQAWADVDRNGCDTRNDILARDLVSETFKPGTATAWC